MVNCSIARTPQQRKNNQKKREIPKTNKTQEETRQDIEKNIVVHFQDVFN